MVDLRVSQVATEALLEQETTARISQVVGEVVVIPSDATARVTQLAIEVLTVATQPAVSRISQVVGEVIVVPDNATARVTQIAIEVLLRPNYNSIQFNAGIVSAEAFGTPVVSLAGGGSLRASQVAIEALLEQDTPARVSQVVGEVFVVPSDATARVTQLAIEVITVAPQPAVPYISQVVSEVIVVPDNTTARVTQVAIEVLLQIASLLVDLDTTTNGIPTAVAFGTPLVDLGVDISTTGIASSEAFGSATITQKIEMTGIASDETFGTPAIDLGVDIVCTGIASTEVFGTLEIHLKVEPSGIASGEAVGSDIYFYQKIEMTGIASAGAFGTSNLIQHVLPSSIASVEGFGDTHVTDGDSLIPFSILTAEAFGLPIIGTRIEGVGITSAEAFGTLEVKQKVEATSIVSAEAFSTGVDLHQKVVCTGIASTEVFGTLEIHLKVEPSGIASGEAVGSDIYFYQKIEMTGIASAGAFGTPVIDLGVDIVCTGIASTGVFGTTNIASVIIVSGISTSESLGTPQVIPVVKPSVITSAEAFGTSILTHVGPQTITLTGIAAGSLGTPVIQKPIPITLSSGIASAGAFGTATIAQDKFGEATLTGTATITARGVGEYVASATLTGEATITATAEEEINRTWNGSTSSWNIGSNWLPTGVPDSNTNVTFDGTSVVNCNIDVAVDIKSMTVGVAYSGIITNTGFSVDVLNDFTFGGSGTLNCGSGDWTINGDILMNGTIINGNSSIWTIVGNVLLNSSGYARSTEEFILINSGEENTVNFNGNPIHLLTIDCDATTKILTGGLFVDEIEIASGTLELDGFNFGFTIPGTFVNHGTLIATGTETIYNFTMDDSDGIVIYIFPANTTGLNLGNNYYNLELTSV